MDTHSTDFSFEGLYHGPEGQDDMPFLLTGGPLTTSHSVKLAMLADWNPRDTEFLTITNHIRGELKRIAEAGPAHDCVLMQGPDNFIIEAALGSFAPIKRERRKTLVMINGSYSLNAAVILDSIKRPFSVYDLGDEATVNARTMRNALKLHQDVGLVYVAHTEPISGITNALKETLAVTREFELPVMVDARASIGGVPLNMEEDGIDVLIGANDKCLEGVPGFGFAICAKTMLAKAKGRSHCVALDIYQHWQNLEANGQIRFTPPTHALVAFAQALQEHSDEGGTPGRKRRYYENRTVLLNGMLEMGFEPLLAENKIGIISQTYLMPKTEKFQFSTFQSSLRRHGFAIDAAQLTKRTGFRIATIGHIDSAVIQTFLRAVKKVLAEMNCSDNIAA